jgi:hypothetical protein
MKNVLSDILKQVNKYFLNQIHFALPGIIIKFDAETKLAQVQPSIKKRYIDGTIQEMPNIIHVPVIFSQSKKFSDTFPLENGDGVLLIFSERALEQWLDNGHNSEPGVSRKFDLSDAIAIPGLFAKDADLNYDDTNVIRNFNGGIFKMQPDKKFAIGNEDAELFDIIDRLINAIKSATYGGNPLDNPAPFNTLQSDLSKIRGSL